MTLEMETVHQNLPQADLAICKSGYAAAAAAAVAAAVAWWFLIRKENKKMSMCE